MAHGGTPVAGAWHGVASEAVGAALVLGPFLGGLLLEHLGGRSPFAFAAGLGFIALLAIGFVPVPWGVLDSGDHRWFELGLGTQSPKQPLLLKTRLRVLR